jgi:hypothetical protein
MQILKVNILFDELRILFYLFIVLEDMDPFEMLEAVNILERLSKDFFEKIVK